MIKRLALIWWLAITVTLTLLSLPAFSEPALRQEVPSSVVYSVTGEISFARLTATKRKVVSKDITVDCVPPGTPGKLSPIDHSTVLFTPLTDTVKKLRKRARNRFGSLKAAPIRMRNRRAKLQAIVKSGVCEQEQSEPSPTPSASPTPTPTPEPNFHENGDVTAAGKIAFDIPQDLSANRFLGEVKYEALCQNCHEPRGLFWHFDELRYLTLNVMMIPLETLPDQDLADIVAHLNRFDP